MKKLIILGVLLIALLCIAGCAKKLDGDALSAGEDEENRDYFAAKVLDVHLSNVEVECMKLTSGVITEGTRLSVTKKVASESEVPKLSVGDTIWVFFTGVKETDPPRLDTVWGIYLQDEDGYILMDGSKVRGPVTTDADWGITLSAKDVTPTGMTLVISQSGGEVTGRLGYGTYYNLMVLKDGGFRKLPYATEGNVGWDDLGHSVTMEGSKEEVIDWEWLYGSLAAGTYRISKAFTDSREPGDFDKQMLYLEFEVK